MQADLLTLKNTPIMGENTRATLNAYNNALVDFICASAAALPHAYGYTINLDFPSQGEANTNWNSYIAIRDDPFPMFPFQLSFLDLTPVRYMTADEQAIMHRALRRSGRIIHEPAPPA